MLSDGQQEDRVVDVENHSSQNVSDVYLQPSHDGTTHVLESQNIRIFTCPVRDVIRDSCKVKSNVVVDYGWEMKYYHGRLVAVHKDGNFVAYTLQGKDFVAVRVYCRKRKARSLIKGFTGRVFDIAWAHISSPLYLACVDQGGDLWVYQVISHIENDFTVDQVLRLGTHSGTSDGSSTIFRLCWCPYVPDDASATTSVPTEDASSAPDNTDGISNTDATASASPAGSVEANDQYSRMLILTHENKVKVVNLEACLGQNTTSGSFDALDNNCCTEIKESSDVTAVTMSPDGTALALANDDGVVKFYVLEDSDDGVRCAYEWKPHNGARVNSLVFLDNVKQSCPDVQFWKFVLTASAGNRELKLWSCETWQCLQTVYIRTPYNAEFSQQILDLQLTVDWTSSYIFLSDIVRKALYILQLKRRVQAGSSATGAGDNEDKALSDEGSVQFCSFSDFPLVQPCLSFGVLDAARKRFRPFSPSSENDQLHNDHGDIDNETDSKVSGVRAILYAVNPKSLLELEIRYQPDLADKPIVSSPPAISNGAIGIEQLGRDSSVSTAEFNFRDELSDLSGSFDYQADRKPPPPSALPTMLLSPQDVLDTCPPPPLAVGLNDARNSGNDCGAAAALVDAQFGSAVEALNTVDTPVLDAHHPQSSPQSSVGLKPDEGGRNEGSASPDSQEVSHILAHDGAPRMASPECPPASAAVSDAIDSLSSVIETGAVLSPGRPKTPVAEVLDDLKVDNDECDSGVPDYVPLSSTDVCLSSPDVDDDGAHSPMGQGDHDGSVGGLHKGIDRVMPTGAETIEEIKEEIRDLRKMCADVLNGLNVLRGQQQPLAGRAIVGTGAGSSGGSASAVTSGVHQVQLTNVLMALEHEREAIQKLTANLASQQAAPGAAFGSHSGSPAQPRAEVPWTEIKQMIQDTVHRTFSAAIREELQNVAAETIQSAMKAIAEQIRMQMLTVLSTTDNLLRENIAKMVKSKPILDTLGGSITSSISTDLQSTYRDAFAKIVVPSFDTACKGLFSQMDDAFRKGTKEHVDQLTKQSNLLKKQMQEFQSGVVVELETRHKSFSESVEEKLEAQVTAASERMQKELFEQLKSLLTDELSAIREQQAALTRAIRSAAPTPVPAQTSVAEVQTHLLSLIQNQRVNDAFQQALSANDITLVVWLCGKINPSQLFAQSPIPLEQVVILSLIQQLASDLNTHTELKLKYLEEAMLVVDRKQATTKDHVAAIIPGLINNINQFLKQAPPNSPHLRSMKMLMMAARGLVS